MSRSQQRRLKIEPDDLSPLEIHDADVRMKLGETVKQIRKEQRYSEGGLAARVGLRPADIQDLEVGVGSHPLDVYMRVLFFLGHGLYMHARPLEGGDAAMRRWRRQKLEREARA